MSDNIYNIKTEDLLIERKQITATLRSDAILGDNRLARLAVRAIAIDKAMIHRRGLFYHDWRNNRCTVCGLNRTIRRLNGSNRKMRYFREDNIILNKRPNCTTHEN